jgi:hypothetical protein
MEFSTGVRRIWNGIVGNFTNLYFGQPSPGGSTIGSKSNRDAFRPAYPATSGFEFRIPIRCDHRRQHRVCHPRLLLRHHANGPSFDRPNQDWIRQTEFSDGQKSGFAICRCSVAGDPIGPTTNLFRSRTFAWTTMIVGFGGLGLTQETGAALRSLTSGSQRVHV